MVGINGLLITLNTGSFDTFSRASGWQKHLQLNKMLSKNENDFTFFELTMVFNQAIHVWISKKLIIVNSHRL